MPRLGTAQPAPGKLFQRLAAFPSYFGRRQAERLERNDFRPPEPPLWCTAERELREAITEDGDATGPRLRYADWLDKEGDPRGEFIRVQMALADLPEEMAWSPSRERLLMRERALLATHGAQWLAEVAPWSPVEATLTRGFVENVTLTGRTFLSLADGLFRTTPIRRVRLVAVAPFLAELGESPWLGRLRGLDLTANHAGPQRSAEIIASPRASTLRELNLADNDIGAEGGRALCAAQHLTALETLGLAGNRIDAALLASLLGVEHFSRLRNLDISRNHLGADGVSLLAARSRLEQLERLSLAGNRIGSRGVQAFAASPYPTGLRQLDLSDNAIGTAGIASLMTARCQHLRGLLLGFNDLGDVGLRTLVGWQDLHDLRRLDVAGNRLTDAAVKEIAGGPWQHLEELHLNANHIGDAGMFALLTSDRLAHLRVLRLASNSITDFGVRSGLRCETMRRLRIIDLGWNRIGDAGAISLAEHGELEVEELHLRGNSIGLAGAMALLQMEVWPMLRLLDLRDNPRIPPDLQQALRDHFGPRILID